MSHDHATIVIDSDKHFVIDPVTRAITTESPKLKLMQYDHKSERYTFEIPKVIEGHDMTLCNKIRIHYQNTGSSDRHADVHEVKDMQVSGDDPSKLLFSWLIERPATQFAGTLSFAVRFYCILDDSTVDYSWGTDIFNSITVSNGMENTEQVIEDYSDLIASIQKEIADLKLNVGDKTEADTSYTSEVKRDPTTKKLYANDSSPLQLKLTPIYAETKQEEEKRRVTSPFDSISGFVNSNNITFEQLENALKSGRIINAYIDFGEEGYDFGGSLGVLYIIPIDFLIFGVEPTSQMKAIVFANDLIHYRVIIPQDGTIHFIK